MFDRLRSALFGRPAQPASVRRFDGATGGRRAHGVGTFGRVNAEVGGAGQTLAVRSAHLFVNNPLVGSAVGNIIGEAVGSGIRPSPADRGLVERFDLWSESADADGRTDYYGLQAQIVQDVVVRGEAFVLLGHDDSGLTLRVLDVEQVDRSLTRELGDGAQIVSGIEFNNTGRRVAYHISPARLTDTFASWAPPVRVSAEDVLHVFRPLFPGQVRGTPWTASIILTAGELDKLADALLMSASVSAMFCAVITDENAMGAEDPFDGQAQPSLEPGTLLRVGGGKHVTFSNPQQLQSAGELIKAQIRAIGAGLGVPAFMVDGDLSGSNYSSLRAGLLPFRRRIEQFQYHILAPQLLIPVWRRWLATEILAGTISEDVDRRCDWITPKALQVDPAKDIQADVQELAAGLASRTQKINERGWDAGQLDAQIAADRARETELGLTFSPQTQPAESTPRTEESAQ